MRHIVVKGLGRGAQMIYRYNGDPRSDEVVSDRTDRIPLCSAGEMLKKEWKGVASER
jgi:hypothetical protein